MRISLDTVTAMWLDNDMNFGTTIHNEIVAIATGKRYATVTLDGIKCAGPFGGYADAVKFAESIVPAHRRA